MKHFAHYHTTPSPHIVMDSETWEAAKARWSQDIRPDPLRSSVLALAGTPVYVDACPDLWGCETYGQEVGA